MKKRAVKMYRKFHGRDVREIGSMNIPIEEAAKGLVVLGKAHAVEYVTDKLNGGGDGTMAIYRHEFETPAYVCVDGKGRKVVYIVGEKVKTTSAGIEN